MTNGESPELLTSAHSSLVSRLPVWRSELGALAGNTHSTAWFGIISKAVSLCESIIGGCLEFVGVADGKKRTMGQVVTLLKRSSHALPIEPQALEAFFELLDEVVARRNEFVHGAFRTDGSRFALSFLDCCEQLAHSPVVVHVVSAHRDAEEGTAPSGGSSYVS